MFLNIIVEPKIDNNKKIDPNVCLKKYFKAASPELAVQEFKIKGIKVIVLISNATQTKKKVGEEIVNIILIIMEIKKSIKEGLNKIGEGEYPICRA
jgi:hypothetical protein